MKNEIYQVKCDPDCGFMVQSHNENETLDDGQKHAKKFHDMPKITKEDVRASMNIISG